MESEDALGAANQLTCLCICLARLYISSNNYRVNLLQNTQVRSPGAVWCGSYMKEAFAFHNTLPMPLHMQKFNECNPCGWTRILESFTLQSIPCHHLDFFFFFFSFPCLVLEQLPVNSSHFFFLLLLRRQSRRSGYQAGGVDRHFFRLLNLSEITH